MLDARGNGLGDIPQLRRAVGGENLDIVGGADGLLDHRAFGGREVKGQAHDFQRKQQVGKDDGGVDPQSLGGRDGDFGGERGLLADFDEGVVLADFAVLGHVAARLAHKPDRCRVGGKTFTGTDEDRIGRRHRRSKFIRAGEIALVMRVTDGTLPWAEFHIRQLRRMWAACA